MTTLTRARAEASRKRLRQLAGVGNTPLVELDGTVTGNPGVRLFAKYEGANPGGSIKDRVALEMVLSALSDQRFHPGMILAEASSGNTALGVARVASLAGLRSRLYVPSSAGSHRIELMRMLGAEVVLTDPDLGTEGARRLASADTADDPGGMWFLEQHDNPANPMTHYTGTGPEIAAQLPPDALPVAVVGGLGTGGTLYGVAGFLRTINPSLRAFPVVPAGSSRIPGIRAHDPLEVPLHDRLGSSEEAMEVELEEALHYCRYLALVEGMLAGPSSGAALAGAVRAASRVTPGKAVIVVLADHARNYPGMPET